MRTKKKQSRRLAADLAAIAASGGRGRGRPKEPHRASVKAAIIDPRPVVLMGDADPVRRTPGTAAQLKPFWDFARAQLPSNLRAVVDRLSAWSFWDWDSLQSARRQQLARMWDAQHPETQTPTERRASEAAFRQGHKQVAVPRRNAANASRPRPARQRVSDADIRRAHAKVSHLPHHKQCSTAFDLLRAPTSMRAFRMRWNALGLNKKRGS